MFDGILAAVKTTSAALLRVGQYAAVLGGLMGAAIGVMVLTDRDRGHTVNREIFPAFRAITDQCMREEWPHETVRCQGAIELADSCYRGRDATGVGCAASEIYCRLYRLGFDLPPYYTDAAAVEARLDPCRRWW